MVGLDFSAASVAQARALDDTTGADASFVVGTVDEAVGLLGGEAFDLVLDRGAVLAAEHRSVGRP